MSETPQTSSPAPEEVAPVDSSPSKDSTTTNATSAAKKKQPPKKISQEALERRRLGRIKAAETMARKIRNSGIQKKENPLKFSVFENVSLLNQKNYFTDYLKKDDQLFVLRERKLIKYSKTSTKTEKTTSTATPSRETPAIGAPNLDDDEEMDDEDIETDVEKLGSKVIAIHPGSKNIRIGLASDVYPKTFPFVVAIPGKAKKQTFKQDAEQIEDQLEARKGMSRDFKERMRYYKRRIIPNSNDIAANFNKKAKPQTIPEHNDVHRIDYILPKTQDPKSFYVGDDALRVVSEDYKLRYPLLTNGKFNEEEYSSLQEIYGEIQLIISELLSQNFSIKALKNYKATLVVPDLYDKLYVEKFIELLLQMNFQGVAVIQESLAATYGAGVTSACVVDIGAKTTKIACVDEGMVIPNSRATLSFGGDDITRMFYELLKEASFPLEVDESDPQDWSLLEQLKEKYITFQDANITVQLYNFIKRYPDKLSEKYEFKVFDEVMLAPMGLFFPKTFPKPSGFLETPFTKTQSLDIFSSEANDPISLTQKNAHEDNLYSDNIDFEVLKEILNSETLEDGIGSSLPSIAPIEKIIIQSIANASRYNFTKTKSFYENLLIVGGSSKIEALDFILTDRINIYRPKILSLQNLPDFLKNVETTISKFEADNQFSKIESVEELNKLQEKLYKIIEEELAELLQQSNNPTINVEVLPAPREIDPSILIWKGASVFSRLKVVEEFWITRKDWDLLGSRTLQNKVLFSY